MSLSDWSRGLRSSRYLFARPRWNITDSCQASSGTSAASLAGATPGASLPDARDACNFTLSDRHQVVSGSAVSSV